MAFGLEAYNNYTSNIMPLTISGMSTSKTLGEDIRDYVYHKYNDEVDTVITSEDSSGNIIINLNIKNKYAMFVITQLEAQSVSEPAFMDLVVYRIDKIVAGLRSGGLGRLKKLAMKSKMQRGKLD